MINIPKFCFILFISDILTPSLAFDEYHWNDIKAIVHRIARIVITTINSTRVKACLSPDFFKKSGLVR